MKTAEQRVIELERQTKQLQSIINRLSRRMMFVERQAANTYHVARFNESKIIQLQNTARLNEGKVSKLQNLIEGRRY